MASVVVIETATLHDLPGLLDIEQASFDHASERFAARKLHYLIRSPRLTTLVARDSAGPLGWGTAFTGGPSTRRWGRIFALAVHPRARGRGIGRLLTQRLLDNLRRRGASTVYLEVRADNLPAVALYRSMGFRDHRQFPDYYAPGRHALRMIRED